MDLFDRFNSKFGKWYEGLFGADADELRPRDVLRKIIAAMEDNRREGLDKKIYVPNRYIVHLTVADQKEREYLLSFLDEDELVGVLTRFMAQNGYQTRGPLDFTIAEDPAPTPEARAQKLTVTARFEKGTTVAATPVQPKPAVAPAPPQAAPIPPRSFIVDDSYDDEPETVPLIARAGLAITGPDGKRRHFSLSHRRITIGRSRHQSNDVLLDDDGMVSKVHAAIAWSPDGRFTLYDLESTNGVVVNGARIEEHMVLRDGDQIQIGATQIRFEQEEPATNWKVHPIEDKCPETSASFLVDPDGKRHYLGSQTEIGSALTADLAFHDRGLASRHARIVCESAEIYYLTPLSTDQPTEHNGRIVQQGARALLADGDRITMGSLDLVFRRNV